MCSTEGKRSSAGGQSPGNQGAEEWAPGSWSHERPQAEQREGGGASSELEEEQRKHSAKSIQLIRELTEAKQELEDPKQQLQTEKHQRMQLETERLEAVEIAKTIFHKLEDMQRVSEEHSAESHLLSAELKSEKSKKFDCCLKTDLKNCELSFKCFTFGNNSRCR